MNPIKLFNIVYIVLFCAFSIICVNVNWVIIFILLLKIMDLVYLPDYVSGKIKNIIRKDINNYIQIVKPKLRKNAIYILLPHGSSILPAVILPILCNIEDEYPLIMIPKWIQLLPGACFATKIFGNIITNEKGNLKLSISQHAQPFIFYPGGVGECLYNTSKNCKRTIFRIKNNILKYLVESNRPIHIVSIKNESECYYHSKIISRFYLFLNKYIKIGIPGPYPFYSGKQLKLVISEAIDSSKIKNINELKDIIYKTL